MDSEHDPQMTAMAHASMPFAEHLGISIVSGVPEAVVASVQWKAERCTVGNALHGGFLMAVADSVGAMCAFLNMPDGAATSTVESKTNFLRAVHEQDMMFTSRPVHVGRTVIVVETDGVRADGELATRTTQTQLVHSPGGDK